jgi:Tfp pilus assembly protein PilP
MFAVVSLVGVAQIASAQSLKEARANPAKTAQPPAPKPALSPASDTTPKVLITREVFQYEGDARRDPFVSLLSTKDLRPMLVDLKLVAVAFDPRGQNSVAVLRDVTSKDQYRVRVGQTIGRMRVAAIQEKAVIFTIEEFGYSRQEILPFVTDSTKTRPRQ